MAEQLGGVVSKRTLGTGPRRGQDGPTAGVMIREQALEARMADEGGSAEVESRIDHRTTTRKWWTNDASDGTAGEQNTVTMLAHFALLLPSAYRSSP